MNLRNAVILFVVSFLGLILYLDRPARLIFDEQFYVPAARGILTQSKDENYQHPPLSKELVALSIAGAGDNPWGWRLASSVMGALSLVAVYFLAVSFLSPGAAVAAVVLVFTNGLFFTLSRLALLEIFTLGFSLLAMAVLMSRLYGPRRSGGWLSVAGALFGLALAAKWSALVPLLVCVAGGLWLRRCSAKEWLGFGVSLVVFYLLPFVILGGEMSVVALHQAMWSFHYPEVYQSGIMERTSSWWQWAFSTTPMWLAVLPNEAHEYGKFLGVMIAGNPLVIWPGWLGVGICLWGLVKRKCSFQSLADWLPALAVAPWLVWAVAQRPVTYYYYFLPSSVFLALALVAAVESLVQQKFFTRKKAQIFLSLWAGFSFLYFVYHWPLMTGLELSASEFQQWYPWLGF